MSSLGVNSSFLRAAASRPRNYVAFMTAAGFGDLPTGVEHRWTGVGSIRDAIARCDNLAGVM